jgi:hypothetical protein
MSTEASGWCLRDPNDGELDISTVGDTEEAALDCFAPMGWKAVPVLIAEVSTEPRKVPDFAEIARKSIEHGDTVPVLETLMRGLYRMGGDIHRPPEYRERDGCWSCRWRCGHPEDLHCAEREKQVQLWGTCGHHEPEEGSE